MAAAEGTRTREAIRQRIECKRRLEKLSLESVESLLEKDISEQKLLEHCRNFWQQSYQDCTEERALVELCGYPVCSNAIAALSKKLPKFRICTKTNRVFSTEKRRLFCSLWCFKSSEWLKSQLSEVPLWMLDIPFDKELTLLTREASSSINNFDDGSVELKANPLTEHQIDSLVEEIETVSIQEPPRVSPVWKLEQPSRQISDIVSIERVESLLDEWFTISTLHFIVGQERFLVLRAQYDKGSIETEKTVDDYLIKYQKLCQFLDAQDAIEGLSNEDARVTPRSKPQPKKKVGFKTHPNKTKPIISNTLPSSSEAKIIEDVAEPVLPPVEKHQQQAIRENILLDRISPCLETVLPLLNSNRADLIKDIGDLIHTFRLTRDNCIINHREAVVIVCVFLMILDRKQGGEGQMPQHVKERFDEPLKALGLVWGDIRLALRQHTEPEKLFSTMHRIQQSDANKHS